MSEPCNIAATLPRMAAEMPSQVAIRCPGKKAADGFARYDVTMTYAELDRRSDAIAAGLLDYGLSRGQRCVLMVRPSPEFFALMFALFKSGIVPVLVDPGIDRRALKQCLAEAQPSAFIGIPIAQAARHILGWARGQIRHSITVGRRWMWGGARLQDIERRGASAGPQLQATGGDEVAAILFTSGSTGVPKGVVYRHRHFVAQIEMLGAAFGIEPGGVDLPTFPPFALFDPALGLTSVIPDMDPTRPASADPKKLHNAIERFGVTQLFGSPALVAVLSQFGRPLPGVRRVLSAGAPVPADVVTRMRELLPLDGELWTPYGATECLPVAVIESRELQATRPATESGAGTCVGTAVPPNVVRIIAISDAPIASWNDVEQLDADTVGEITVAGPSATDAYFNRPQATAQAKIREQLPDGSERIVHRMGDLGYFDAQGRLWFCGRKTQRVSTATGALYTEQVEPVFNTHDGVRRTALVGVEVDGYQLPVLCVELKPGVAKSRWPTIEKELRELAARHPHCAAVQHFLPHAGFPVDIRHNAKIGREQLARWAAMQRRMTPSLAKQGRAGEG